MNEKQLRSIIKKIILEDSSSDKKSDKDNKASKTAKIASDKKKSRTVPGTGGIVLYGGSGQYKREINEAGALAIKDPKKLMSNLEISGSFKDFKGVESVISQALSGTKEMREAYASVEEQERNDTPGLVIKMRGLSNRDGAKYLHHTLTGALNAGILRLGIPIRIQRLRDGSVGIYSSNKKAWDV
jgi:hypothetical protein